MSEKLRILKDSVDQVLTSEYFYEYKLELKKINDDSQYQMYHFVLNNKEKFSINVVDDAKLKYIKKEQRLNEYRKEIDQIFNQLLKLYNKY